MKDYFSIKFDLLSSVLIQDLSLNHFYHGDLLILKNHSHTSTKDVKDTTDQLVSLTFESSQLLLITEQPSTSFEF